MFNTVGAGLPPETLLNASTKVAQAYNSIAATSTAFDVAAIDEPTAVSQYQAAASLAADGATEAQDLAPGNAQVAGAASDAVNAAAPGSFPQDAAGAKAASSNAADAATAAIAAAQGKPKPQPPAPKPLPPPKPLPAKSSGSSVAVIGVLALLGIGLVVLTRK